MKKQALKNKYKITLKTKPSKTTYTQEEADAVLHKAIDILVDDLILNGHIKIGE